MTRAEFFKGALAILGLARIRGQSLAAKPINQVGEIGKECTLYPNGAIVCAPVPPPCNFARETCPACKQCQVPLPFWKFPEESDDENLLTLMMYLKQWSGPVRKCSNPKCRVVYCFEEPMK